MGVILSSPGEHDKKVAIVFFHSATRMTTMENEAHFSRAGTFMDVSNDDLLVGSWIRKFPKETAPRQFN